MFTFFYLSIVFTCTAALAQQDTNCFDDAYVAPPEYNSTLRLRHGDFFFPDLTFNCGGTIKNITMGVNFIKNSTYSSMLTVNVSLWSKNGTMFHRVIGKKDHVISLYLSDGDYPRALRRKPNGNLLMGTGATVSILFPDVDIHVEEGEILGLSLPKGTESTRTGITVAINTNYSDSPIVTMYTVRFTKGCWSTDGFVSPCQVQAIAGYGKPFITFDFIRDSVHVPEPDTSADSETEFQINGPIAAVFAAVLGTLACASLVLLAAFLSASLCCRQKREKGVMEFREPYVTEKSIELAGDSDVKPTACDPQYDYAHVTIVRGPTKPSTVGLSPEMHSYSRLRQENGTVIGENPKYVSTPGGGGGYSVMEFREPYVTKKSIKLAGDSDVKPTACDPQYDYAHVTIVRGPTKPSTVGLSPEMHSYSRLRQENGTMIGENPKYVSTPGSGGGYDSIDQSAQYLNTSINVTNPGGGPDKQPQI